MENGKIILGQKIEIPEVSDNFSVRNRLTERLNQAEKPLVIVNAGMGYGKTVMLSHFARSCKDPCIWLRLRTEDQKLPDFLRQLGTALQVSVPDFTFDASGEPDPNCMTEQIKNLNLKRIFIILDDFHLASSGPVCNFLRRLLDEAPTGMHMILSARKSLPPFCARYLLERKAVLIGEDVLAFNHEEIQKIIADFSDPEKLEETANSVYLATDGWPAAVSFLSLYYQGKNIRITTDNLEQAIYRSYLQDYYMYELYQQISPEMQMFMKNISVLDTLDPERCAALTGDLDSAEKIAQIVRNNLFVCPSGNGDEVRFQKLFRVFLLRQLEPEEKRELLEKAAALEHPDGDGAKNKTQDENDKSKDLFAFLDDDKKIQNQNENVCSGSMRVHVFCFGKLRVLLPDGKTLHWRTRKAQELFAYLFHLNGNYAEREKLIDLLWPNCASSNATALLHTSLYSIRKNLVPYGMEQLIEYDKQGYRMNMAMVDSDREKMEMFCRGDVEQGALYQGAYLEDIEAIWAEDARAWYTGLFLNSIRSIADDLIRSGDHRNAVICLRAALRQEPYDEGLAATLIRCYTALGEVRNAMTFYNNLKDVLMKDLGAEPSDEVTQAYKECLLNRLSSRR